MKIKLTVAASVLVGLLLAPSPVRPTMAASTMTGTVTLSSMYDVRAFGAKGDGKTLDTPAFNNAIAAAGKAGGGTVEVPAGTYLCTSIHLQSNITLYLDQGATIQAADTDAGRLRRGGAVHRAGRTRITDTATGTTA